MNDTVVVGQVALRNSGTRAGMKRFHSKVNKSTIQANSHIAKTTMFNTPGETFIDGRPDAGEILIVLATVLSITGLGMAVGFYGNR